MIKQGLEEGKEKEKIILFSPSLLVKDTQQVFWIFGSLILKFSYLSQKQN